MTDRLDAIEADLERPEVLNTENGCSVANVGSGDVRWLVAEVRRLRGELQDERLSLAPLREAHAEALNAAAQNEAALAALRQRHAELEADVLRLSAESNGRQFRLQQDEAELLKLRARLATAEAERDEAREDVEVAEKEARVAAVRGEREADMKPVEVQSAREKAEALLAFRDAYAPDNKRFHQRALLVDNGERGSEQKAVVFTADDLAALLMDLRDSERQRDQWKEFAFKHPELTPPAVTQELLALRQRVRDLSEHHAFEVVDPVGGPVAAPCAIDGCQYAALRQRHAEAVEKAFRAGYSAGGDDMSAAHHNEYYVGEDAAWLASEAKARLT